MYRTLIRLLAVCLLALSPLWGVGSVAARPAGYPVWPSFLSTGCNSVSSSAGGTTTVCGVGGSLLTQVNSGYPCNRLDIGISAFSSGPFIITGLADSESIENTITVNDTGDYTMDFPGFLVNNSIIIQMSAPDSGSMTVAYIQTIPCPVATATATINPSSTATNTPVPVTGTATPIPTYTPLPSGHSTFSPTATRTATTTPVVPTATSTPVPLRNCGINMSFFDCDDTNYSGGPNWFTNGIPCQPASIPPNPPHTIACANSNQSWQPFIAPGNGTVTLSVTCVGGSGNGLSFWDSTGTPINYINNQGGTCASQTLSISVTGGTQYRAGIYNALGSGSVQVIINSMTFTLTPGLPTLTSTPTSAPTATSIPTASPTAPTQTPTVTAIPIPGAQSTAIPTDTPCPGGCAVKQLTQVPGFATRVLVDTSPFSALEHLSLARSSCQPFGYVQIPVPVIHGTPALGSTTPLSFTWTAPVTHTWDDTNVFSNTALQPCAMVNEIPSFVWDLTYWLSVLMCAVGWFMWLIGFVGRLSGDETING